MLSLVTLWYPLLVKKALTAQLSAGEFLNINHEEVQGHKIKLHRKSQVLCNRSWH